MPAFRRCTSHLGVYVQLSFLLTSGKYSESWATYACAQKGRRRAQKIGTPVPRTTVPPEKKMPHVYGSGPPEVYTETHADVSLQMRPPNTAEATKRGHCCAGAAGGSRRLAPPRATRQQGTTKQKWSGVWVRSRRATMTSRAPVILGVGRVGLRRASWRRQWLRRTLAVHAWGGLALLGTASQHP